MNYIDLHVHSNASDGTLTPTEIVQTAIESGLKALALTDHDTVQGVEEAMTVAKAAQAAGAEFELIPGMELSVGYRGRDIHILGLFVDYKNRELVDFLDSAKQERKERNIKMAANLQAAGLDISMEALEAENEGAVLTRAHFARHLVEVGAVKNKDDAFRKYLDASTPYYVPRHFFTPEDAIKHIHGAGGVAVLAHPMLYKYNRSQIEKLVVYLKELGLDGLEVIYSMNSEADEYFVRNLARRQGLKMSGGSDFHGANKPEIKLGVGRGKLKIPYSLAEELRP